MWTSFSISSSPPSSSPPRPRPRSSRRPRLPPPRLSRPPPPPRPPRAPRSRRPPSGRSLPAATGAEPPAPQARAPRERRSGAALRAASGSLGSGCFGLRLRSRLGAQPREQLPRAQPPRRAAASGAAPRGQRPRERRLGGSGLGSRASGAVVFALGNVLVVSHHQNSNPPSRAASASALTRPWNRNPPRSNTTRVTPAALARSAILRPTSCARATVAPVLAAGLLLQRRGGGDGAALFVEDDLGVDVPARAVDAKAADGRRRCAGSRCGRAGRACRRG